MFIASCSEGVGEGVLEISRPKATELSDAFNAVVEDMSMFSDDVVNGERTLRMMVANLFTFQLEF